MNTAITNAVVIVAAGRGERIGKDGNGPKQYRKLGHKAILAITIEAFATHPQIDAIVVVIHADDGDLYREAVMPHIKLLPPVIGGATRQESCAEGVFALEGLAPQKLLIHDAARPFVSHETISAVLAGIDKGFGALPVHAVSETLKRSVNGLVVETVPRNDLFFAQTPQGFAFGDILNAHRKARIEGLTHFTDDAAVSEWAGQVIRAIAVSSDNLKITTPEDLEWAQERMQTKDGQRQMVDVRTGNGYDVHASSEGDHVWLCGVKIAHDSGLDGHSDADVGLHALTDALLGTIGEGDIGSHFPPSDPQWKGASSDRFLAHAVALVRAQGGTITNLDVTLICEAPKIVPHREAMRSRIADIAGLAMKRVSVKATTNEKLGFVGRKEGIAAIATATAVFCDMK